MNTLSIWNPIHEMDALFHNRLASVLGGEGQASVAWSPVVDIEETEQDYVIRAELPGLDKDKVKVTVEDGVLTLSGERDLERTVEGKPTIASNARMAPSAAASPYRRIAMPKVWLRNSQTACWPCVWLSVRRHCGNRLKCAWNNHEAAGERIAPRQAE